MLLGVSGSDPSISFWEDFILGSDKLDSSDSSWDLGLSLGDKGVNFPILAHLS